MQQVARKFSRKSRKMLYTHTFILEMKFLEVLSRVLKESYLMTFVICLLCFQLCILSWSGFNFVNMPNV